MKTIGFSAIAAAVLLAASTARALLTEKQTLEHLYHNLNGDNWDTPWDLTGEPCSASYPGVVCDSSDHVIEIDLSDNNLVGSITPHLYVMPHLKKVDFSKNSINNAGWDRIDLLFEQDPDAVITQIEVMHLTSNRIHSLQGVQHLKDSLTGLHLTYNSLKSWQDELFTLKNLEVLAISENEIVGSVDTRIGGLVHLREFYCYGNLLTGTFPSEIGKLNKLQILTFAENQLTGPLPQSLENMPNLHTFSVHNNDNEFGHTGPLPKFDRHPFLNEVYLDGNNFEGSIPSEFLSLVNATDDVVTIGLSDNMLTGTIPDNLARFSSLNLNVVGNNITGMGNLCDKDLGSWMNGLVEQFGCDAILCPVNFYAATGRQEEEESPCRECPEGTGGYMGARDCDSDQVDTSELEILAEFYLACLGPQWDSAQGWIVMVDIESPFDMTLPSFSNVNHCSFEGVTCENGKVVALVLPSNGLEGMIPDSLWDLQELREVDLSGNELYLDRDYGFGNIGNAKSLVKVDLSSNDIQKFTGIGRAKLLQELYIDDAYFFGGINPIIYELTHLKILHIQYSGLKGQVPKGLSKLTNLTALNLYGNQLTGKIPSEIGLMPNLWHIDFSENDFTGELPVEAISKLSKLQKFHVSQSSRSKSGITGKLPSFEKNINLHMLDVSSNSMTGSIPSNFLSGVENVNQFMDIHLAYNSFTGTVPGSLAKFTNMNFDAVKTQLTAVPSSFCFLSDWMNGQVGKVIDEGGNGCDAILCPKGTFNDFGRAKSGANGACKSCSSGKYAGQTTCSGVSQSNDNLEKDILDKLFVETAGPDWEKGENWANGDAVCSYEGIICSKNGTNINEGVVEIHLVGFGLTGNIPTDIYKLPYLKKVDFSNNVVDLSFVGIEQSATLESIIIADADLTSVLGIGNAPSTLKKLHIPRNSFPPGHIPQELYTATSLQSISIGFNGFDGSISADISKLTNLQEFWAGGNDLTGTIPIELTKLSTLMSINLSGNRMSGDIPNELENIKTLRFLNLAGQRDFGGFSGPVPSFNHSSHLHEIDISRNSLTGTVPSDFLLSVRTSSSHDDYSGVQIDLSSNRITGPIPSEFDYFASLFLNLAGNMITSVPSTICDDDDEFQNGLVGQLTENKCDAILCPPGTFSAVGRQTDVDISCEACPGGKDEAPYFGSMKCQSVSGERRTLLHLYDLIFTGASIKKYWNTDNPICTWYGITCSGDDSDEEGVIEINLESNSLASDNMDEVSNLFFSLPNLKVLNIRGNKLPLKLDNIGSAKNLELLQLSATGLSTISGISAASNLKEFHITENEVKGPFPTEILNLTLLERLYISFNEISGTLPNRIGTLSDLKEFFAYTNAMTGTIPTQLGSLAQLERLVLGQNNFKGTLPTQLNNLSNLKELSFYHEESNGELNGRLLSLSKVTHLESLDLEGNKFTGSIPSTFLSGLDSDYISSRDNEVILHLADNALTGTLPLGLEKIENLFIDIAGNNIKGPIPSSFCQKSSWMRGKVGEVMSCDAIACPANTFSPTGRGYAEADDDSVQGCTPCGGLQKAPYLGSYACSQEIIEAGALKALYHATGGMSWSQRTNWMDDSKPICSWYGIKCSGGSVDNNTVIEIVLGNNNLEGTMPSAIWQLPFLTNLDLRENSLLFIGFDNIENAKKLETLYISDVDIGNVRGIGGAPALRELHLTSNDLSGTFPDEFFNLAPTLEQLFLAYNSFSGTLSSNFGKFTKLTNFYAYDNDFTGTIPSELATLKNLQNLVLAENKLSGTIPSGFSDMPSLKLFSAYRRLKPGPKLSGRLPSFSRVPQLEGLYLDYNQLSGPIPLDFLASSLGTKLITISHNSLTGSVPLQLDNINDLNIEMEGNKFSDLSYKFCDNDGWMNGAVSFFECDAIMCPPHTYSKFGRQNSTDSVCQYCDKNSDSSPYWGSVSCDVVVDEKEILKILYNRCGGANWYRKDNWMTSKDVCTWYGIECRDTKSVQAIRLGANNLIGTPPHEIFGLKQLHTLWLHSNPIDFKFSGIEKAENLVELRLDSTGLSDLYGLEHAKSLVKLNLKYNRIAGTFPQEIFQLDNLEELELTDNLLTGTLPRSFGKVINLVSLKLGSNDFSGPLRGFSAMEFLLHIDLSDNKLSGTIPANLLESVSTRKPVEVDLSSNNLSGKVPTDLDRFDNLVIYLRDNRITELPATLCDLNNRGWNLRDVELFGCDAILCPPGTANYHGRQSSESTRCEKCKSNTNLYGQVSCNGVRLTSSGSYVRQGAKITYFSLLVAIGTAIML